MADLTAVCNALAAVITPIIPRTSPTFAAQVNPPAAVIIPQPTQALRFDTFGGGVSYLLRLILLAAYTEDQSSVALMNSWLASSGPTSIDQAIRSNPSLNGAVESANMDSVRGYGLMEWAGQQYLGSQVLITVMAT